MKRISKLIIICVLLVPFLVSCTNTTDDVSNFSNISVAESEETNDNSAEASSEASIEEESSNEASVEEESSNEEPIVKPVLQTEMTDEMIDVFRAYDNFNPPEKDHAYYELAIQRYNEQIQNTKDQYYAYGLVGNATLCQVVPCWRGYPDALGDKVIDNYLFKVGVLSGSPSFCFLYLYQDGNFMPVEKGFEEGLVTPKEVYELVNANPAPYPALFIEEIESTDVSTAN